MKQGALHHFLVSPPIDPATPPIASPTRLSYPANDAAYQDHLNRKKCGLLTGTNTQAIVISNYYFILKQV